MKPDGNKAGTKKSGPEAATLNLHSQPRLPGSVVGDASMGYVHGDNKITEGHWPKVTRKKRHKIWPFVGALHRILTCFSYLEAPGEAARFLPGTLAPP